MKTPLLPYDQQKPKSLEKKKEEPLSKEGEVKGSTLKKSFCQVENSVNCNTRYELQA